ncbi:hypothetical protein AB1Y20_015648 [Prymnesium parvum]|uniref:Small VCP/p97-interacting protein n=1 Tax=Prymnesium parvum TaxID=97485 RepID=A0AB34K3M2_PRYPA
MGGVCCCLGGRESGSDPILDAEARARAAEAAQRRQEQYENSAAGRAAKRAAEKAERERRAPPVRGGEGLATRWD